MGHTINFQNIANEALLLEVLAFSSREYISALKTIHPHNLGQLGNSELEIEVIYYENWLTETVSAGLISIAAKIRVLQDTYGFQIDGNPNYSADLEAFNKFDNIALVCDGEIDLSIRECCNKVIHATQCELLFNKDDYGVQFWTGICILKGNFRNKNWGLNLNVGIFCSSIKYYLSIINHLL